MKESIYTIPISEVFEPKCGCPLCTLHHSLETRWVEYITGAAMMEPDVREQTNALGFCARHFEQMLAQRNRLAVALLLQTRLDHIRKSGLQKTDAARRMGVLGKRAKTNQTSHTCFVCERIEREFARMVDNLVTVWERDESFRALYAEQEYLCYPHFGLVCDAAQVLRKKNYASFLQVTTDLTKKGLEGVAADVDAFCQLFDYRNAGSGAPPRHVANSIERAIAYLCALPYADEES